MKVFGKVIGILLASSSGLLFAGDHDYQGSETLRQVFELAVEEAGADGEIHYLGGGSSKGEQALVNGEQLLAPMSRPIKEAALEEAAANGIEIGEIVVALDAVSIYTKSSNRLRKLSIENLRDIFTCEKTKWSDFGGAPTTINADVRDEASGTTETFMKLVGIDDFGRCVREVENGRDIAQKTSSDINAIGYSGSDAKTTNNRALSISRKSGQLAYAPTLAMIRSFDYPLTRELYIYWASEGYEPHDHEIDLLEILNDRSKSDAIVEEAGFVTLD